MISEGFRASDGYVVVQVGREHQFAALAEPRRPPGVERRIPASPTRAGWAPNLDSVIRPAVDAWASKRTKLEAAHELTAVGIAAGPSNSAPDVIADPHIAARHMLVEVPRTDGVEPDILVPGNPVKLSKVSEGPESRVPWVGEHTDAVLRAELGVDDAELERWREGHVIS